MTENGQRIADYKTQRSWELFRVSQLKTLLYPVSVSAEPGYGRFVPEVVALHRDKHMTDALKLLVMVSDAPFNFGYIIPNLLQDCIHQFVGYWLSHPLPVAHSS